VWIAIIITAQAFQATPSRHAPAVAFGLFPAIAAWGVVAVTGSLRAVGASVGPEAMAALDASGAFAVTGALHLWAGFLFTATIWAAIGAHLIDRAFRRAAAWALVAAALSALGVIHGFELSPTGPLERLVPGAAGWEIPACYAAFAVIFLVQARGRPDGEEVAAPGLAAP
jgi:AGZA family xanthine/uracil permease-like MFS transporter